MYNFFLVLVLIVLSCKVKKEPEVKTSVLPVSNDTLIRQQPAVKIKPTDSCFFDIDFRNLEGKTRSENEYPSICIKTGNHAKTIVISYSASDQIKEEYIFKNNRWQSYRYAVIDTSKTHTYKFIEKGVLTEFTYSDTSNFILNELVVFSGNSYTMYIPEKKVSIYPDPQNLKKAISYPAARYYWQAIEKGTLVEIVNKKFAANGKILSVEKLCYPNNHRSAYWWYRFDFTIKGEKCWNSVRGK